MDIRGLAAGHEAAAIEIRRHIHRNPELSNCEFETLAFIRKKLEEYGIEYIEVENGGILGFIGSGPEERTVLLRADIDALPIHENARNLTREREVISQNDGVQHACGHDAHTAILLTAGKILKENEAELGRGRVILFFERGEEGMGNIRYLLDHMLAQDTKVAAAHGIHVRPDLPTGVIFSPSGPIMAGATGFTVKIRGRGGHGSRPDLSNNPVDCFVAVYSALMALRVRYVSPFEQLTFSVCTLKGSERGNVIPGEVSFGGTARYYNKAVGQTFIDEFTSILDNVTAAYHCTYETNGMRAGDPTLNNADAGAFARGVIRKYLGEDAVAETTPLMGSESFSLLTQLYPGVMVHLGIGNEGIGSGADLHSEYFDVDEAALALGVAETVGFAVDFIQGDEVFAHTPVRDLDAINSWQNRKA